MNNNPLKIVQSMLTDLAKADSMAFWDNNGKNIDNVLAAIARKAIDAGAALQSLRSPAALTPAAADIEIEGLDEALGYYLAEGKPDEEIIGELTDSPYAKKQLRRLIEVARRYTKQQTQPDRAGWRKVDPVNPHIGYFAWLDEDPTDLEPIVCVWPPMDKYRKCFERGFYYPLPALSSEALPEQMDLETVITEAIEHLGRQAGDAEDSYKVHAREVIGYLASRGLLKAPDKDQQ